ncbi:MAG: hypothetical protein IPP91_19470 [Betaproteobacteria bacterium]|nr:hypothetical protein [Betaproteobacteria bacterium]
MRARLFFPLLIALVPAAQAESVPQPEPIEQAEVDSPLGLSYVDIPDMRLIYIDPALAYLVPHAVRTFANSMSWQRRVLGWNPTQPTTVLLKDFSDYGNASAGAAPRNALTFDIAPLSLAFETYPASERMYSLMNHELVHVSTMDMSSAEDRSWRRFFLGKVYPNGENPETMLYSYLTVPRFTVPRWYLEGSAVFMETWMGGGLGRAQGGYDEMVFRAMVRDNAPFYDALGLVSRGTRVDFQVGVNAYLYGTRFFTYLAYAYSPEKVVKWLRRDEDSKRYYSDHFQQVFGLPIEQAWQDWIAFEREFQRKNLEAVAKYPLTPQRDLVAKAVGSTSRAFYDEATGNLYGAFRYPGVVEHVGVLNTRDGSIRRLTDIKGAMLYRVTSLAYDPAGTIFYTADNYNLRDLMAVDVKTGDEKMLLEDARIGEIVFNPVDRSLLGVRHQNGLATLVRIPPPYTEWSQIHTFPYGVVPYDLDISPDGRLLSGSVAEVNGDQFLRVWQLDKVRAGDLKPLSQYSFGQSVPEGFVFSRDGRFLYGSSYYTGASNIFRYEVATGEVEAVSNAATGFFRPATLADGKLVVFNYTGQGFVPTVIEPKPLKDVSAISFLGAEVAARHPVVKTWQVPPPSNVDYEKLVTGTGVYAPLRNLDLQSGYPVLQGYKNSAGIGYHLNIEDALRIASIGITAAYTPDTGLPSNERAHIEAKYKYLGWNAALSYNRSDFYDLFGPTIRSRKGYAAILGYDHSIIFDGPRKFDAKAEVAYYDKIDALPNYQNVETTFDKLLTAQVGLYFTHTRRSLGAVDEEKGFLWDAVLSTNHVSTETVPQLRGRLDFGFALPIDHSSIWLRTVAGASRGNRDDTLANFYFGGFGNNYVDSGEVKRYREYYALPGFGINEVGGKSFARTLVEWNLPPVVFETLGTPSFHLAWLRPAVFVSGLWTDPTSSTWRKDYASTGAQVDLRFSILHWYDMTLSAGYAVGYREGRRAGDEWMVSLKIM